MDDRHQIPTHLGVQDRFFYGLSMAQLMTLLLGGSSAWAVWDQLPAPAGLRAGLALGALLLTLAFALVRPTQRGLLLWTLALLRFAALPKRCVWRPRVPDLPPGRPDGPAFAPFVPGLAWASPALTEAAR